MLEQGLQRRGESRQSKLRHRGHKPGQRPLQGRGEGGSKVQRYWEVGSTGSEGQVDVKIETYGSVQNGSPGREKEEEQSAPGCRSLIKFVGGCSFHRPEQTDLKSLSTFLLYTSGPLASVWSAVPRYPPFWQNVPEPAWRCAKLTTGLVVVFSRTNSKLTLSV